MDDRENCFFFFEKIKPDAETKKGIRSFRAVALTSVKRRRKGFVGCRCALWSAKA